MAKVVSSLVSRIFASTPKTPSLTPSATRVLKLIPPAVVADSRVLDLGCTDSSLSCHLAQRYRHVTGLVQLDLNDAADRAALGPLQQELASYRVECQVMPTLQTLPAYDESGRFDAAVTEDMLSYCPQAPESILRGVKEALKPGGYFVGEIGADGNLETLRMACYEMLTSKGIDPMKYDPYFFPTEKEFKTLLEQQGFKVEHLTLITERQAFPCRPHRDDMALVDYMHTGVGQRFLLALQSPTDQRLLVTEVVRLCHASMFRNSQWSYPARRIQFVAVNPTNTSSSSGRK